MPTHEELEQVENVLVCDGNQMPLHLETFTDRISVDEDRSFDFFNVPTEWETWGAHIDVPITMTPELWDELVSRVGSIDLGELPPVYTTESVMRHMENIDSAPQIYSSNDSQSIMEEAASLQKKLDELYCLAKQDEDLPTDAYTINFE